MRLEAEFYNVENLNQANLVKGEDIIEFIQYGTSEELNENNLGFPVLRLNEFDYVFIKKPAKYCDKITKQTYQELQLKKNDVLICRTNGNPDLVGRAALVMEDEPYAFASYLFRVRTKEIILPAVLVAYLRGKYGRTEIDKYSMKGNQTNFSPAKFREITIPVLNREVQNAINNLFSVSYSYNKKAKTLYHQAEELLNGYLQIGDISQENAYTVKNLSDSFKISGRLDAEYYQPKYDMVENRIRELPHKKLAEIANVETGNFIEENLYGNQGICYIRGTDIVENTINFDIATKVDVDPKDYKLLNHKDLAFTLIGSVGNVAINENDTAIVSNNLGTISLYDKDYANYVLLFLSCPAGQMLFEKYQTRTAQPKINKKDVEQFIIPILKKQQIDLISAKVQVSFRLRKESKRLLDCAIKAVEMAIETDEETALQWLTEQSPVASFDCQDQKGQRERFNEDVVM